MSSVMIKREDSMIWEALTEVIFPDLEILRLSTFKTFSDIWEVEEEVVDKDFPFLHQEVESILQCFKCFLDQDQAIISISNREDLEAGDRKILSKILDSSEEVINFS